MLQQRKGLKLPLAKESFRKNLVSGFLFKAILINREFK